MPAKKKPARKWTAAQKAAQSARLKKVFAAKRKNGNIRKHGYQMPTTLATAAMGEALIAGPSLSDTIRAEVRKQLPVIIEEEVRSALS